MNRLLCQLMAGGSTLALALITNHAMAQSAPASTPTNATGTPTNATGTPTSEVPEQVVVTGTSIRGVAPVGSNIMSVGDVDIANMGVSNVTEALANVPTISFFGTAGRATTSAINAQPGTTIEIHNFGAMSSASTLTIIDGHRAIQSGATNYYVNPNQIPANMIQTVDVLADGASAVYGSDAVAGVVNLITKSQFEGVQFTNQERFTQGETDYVSGILLGHSWSDGSFVFGATYTHDGLLKDTSRPYLNPADYPAEALAAGIVTPAATVTSNSGQNFFCSPATIAPAGQSLIYTSPTSGVAVANTLGNSTCNQFNAGAILPSQNEANAMLKVTQQFGSRFTVEADILVYQLQNQQPISVGTLTGTAFSTGPQANPFYQSPVGYTGTATSETIRYDFNGLLPPGEGVGGIALYNANLSVDYNVDDNWDVNFYASTGHSDTTDNTFNTLNTANALLALNGTAITGGSTTTSDILGKNVVQLNLPLTTSNALDVWDPVSTNKTSAALLSPYGGPLDDSTSIEHGYFGQINSKLTVQGSPFSLPAGPVKMAAGVEIENYSENIFITAPSTIGGASYASTLNDVFIHRNDTAEYIEFDVPLLSADMGIPYVQKLELDVAGRHDYFLDTDSCVPCETYNPKIGLNWNVMDGLKVRANWSTSFVTPVLTLEGAAVTGIASFSKTGGSSNPGNLEPYFYPLVTEFGIPGCGAAQAGSTTPCSAASLQGVADGHSGVGNEVPALGRTWSVGFDYAPDFLKGFSSEITFWNYSLTKGYAAPSTAISLTNATLTNFLTLFPGCATSAQIAPYLLSNKGYPVPLTAALPTCVQYGTDAKVDNYLYLYANGLDIQVDYKLDTSYGIFSFDDMAVETLKFDNGYGAGGRPPDDQIFSTLNTSGINTGYNAIATTMRGHIGWNNWGVSVDAYMNWTGAYRNVSNTALDPLQNNVNNVPSGIGGDHVDANVTFDMHLGYDFNGGILGDDNIGLIVDNVFGKRPPFYEGASGYDTLQASPIGRSYVVQLKAHLD
jgi:iron complex outermembrane receptor protein